MVKYTRHFETNFDGDRDIFVQIPIQVHGYSEDIKNATSGMCPRNILLFVKMYKDNP
jgi:hypothetical protein